MKKLVKLAKVALIFSKYLAICCRQSSYLLRNINYFIAVYTNRKHAGITGLFSIGGIEIETRVIDWVAFEEIVMQQEYGFLEKLLVNLDKPLVVDLGANVGFFSAVALSMNPICTVHSVEAGPGTFLALKGNMERNPGHNWSVHHYAIFDQAGSILFDEGDYSTGGHISGDSHGTEVDTITLQEMVASVGGKVDILKMDIEGVEERVIASNPEILKEIKHLIIEIHPNSCSLKNTVDYLSGSYRFIYEISGRNSSKPLLLATNLPQQLPKLTICK